MRSSLTFPTLQWLSLLHASSNRIHSFPGSAAQKSLGSFPLSGELGNKWVSFVILLWSVSALFNPRRDLNALLGHYEEWVCLRSCSGFIFAVGLFFYTSRRWIEFRTMTVFGKKKVRLYEHMELVEWYLFSFPWSCFYFNDNSSLIFFFPARIVGWSFSSWCCKAVVWFWGLECSLSYLLVLWAVGSCICLCFFFCCCSWCLLTLSWMSVLKNKEACSLFV